MRNLVLSLVISVSALAEDRALTLKEAVDLALKQNPDLMLARIDEQKAAQQVQIAKDPFIPKVGAGSGLAYSYGFPMTIEGSGPSIFQVRARGAIYNKPLSYQVAATRETARGASIDTASKRDEAVWQTASLFLDAERAAREQQLAGGQVASLEKVAETVRARVAEGRELEIENKRAQVNLARARQRAAQLQADQVAAEESLAVVLGFPPGDRVRVTPEDERAAPPLPASEEAAVNEALESSKEVRRLESALLAKQFEIRSYKASWVPQIDLLAQYAVFAKFNNYEDYFQRFQRHNAQLGMSLQVPVFSGSAPKAQATQAQLDSERIRAQINQLRGKITSDTRQSYREIRTAETARDVTRLDLELAREQVSLLLAQMEEGRATLRQVEDARIAEAERWLAYYDSRYALEKARLNLLRGIGNILAAIR